MFQRNSKTRFKRYAAAALACLLPALVQAQGSQPFVGQILYVGFNFAPVGWNLCDGSLLSISNNSVLFQLIGTTYGGDGVNTFAVPDLRGRMPIHTGFNGTSNYVLGQMGGIENVTLTTAQMPAHTHAVNFSAPVHGASGVATSAVPTGHSLGNTGRNLSYATTAPNVSLAGGVSLGNLSAANTGAAGGNLPFSIQQPYLGVTCVISLFGIFPSQN